MIFFMINYRVPHHVHIVYIKGRKPLHLRKGVISILQVAIVQVKTLRMLIATTVMLLESVLLKKMNFKMKIEMTHGGSLNSLSLETGP